MHSDLVNGIPLQEILLKGNVQPNVRGSNYIHIIRELTLWPIISGNFFLILLKGQGHEI